MIFSWRPHSARSGTGTVLDDDITMASTAHGRRAPGVIHASACSVRIAVFNDDIGLEKRSRQAGSTLALL
jgi:hypothetical protein